MSDNIEAISLLRLRDRTRMVPVAIVLLARVPFTVYDVHVLKIHFLSFHLTRGGTFTT
jgi:hypothetical protein